MPFWTRSTVSSVASTKWTEDVALKCAEKALDTSVKTTTPSDGPTLPPPALSNGNGGSSRKRKSARVGVSFSVHWEKFRRRIGTGTAPSTSSILNESAADSSILPPTHCYRYEDEDVDVDDVVVDRIWSEELKSSVSHSENGVSPEKSGDSHPQTAVSDHESIVPHGGFWASSTALIILRWRVWPAVKDFFDSKFTDEKSEQHYAQENWFHSKVRLSEVDVRRAAHSCHNLRPASGTLVLSLVGCKLGSRVRICSQAICSDGQDILLGGGPVLVSSRCIDLPYR